jgi:hypothetical protein
VRQRTAYDERVALSDRIARRADALVADQLRSQGRLPTSATEAEYAAALAVAHDELRAEAQAAGPDVRALRATPAAREAVDRCVQMKLAIDGLTLADLDQDRYLARYAAPRSSSTRKAGCLLRGAERQLRS